MSEGAPAVNNSEAKPTISLGELRARHNPELATGFYKDMQGRTERAREAVAALSSAGLGGLEDIQKLNASPETIARYKAAAAFIEEARLKAEQALQAISDISNMASNLESAVNRPHLDETAVPDKTYL